MLIFVISTLKRSNWINLSDFKTSALGSYLEYVNMIMFQNFVISSSGSLSAFAGILIFFIFSIPCCLILLLHLIWRNNSDSYMMSTHFPYVPRKIYYLKFLLILLLFSLTLILLKLPDYGIPYRYRSDMPKVYRNLKLY